MTLVWATEALNTAVGGLLADAATSEFHPLIGRAKIAAAAVTCAAIGAINHWINRFPASCCS